ncbi:hypothetical protein VTP01DRAFT_5704 [Rhizomucor pusillus]|uniref:uncharacterized protein n=1 Tax=Rhizomucor pusillus TaxID=4840 RepID=UPI003743CED2
MLGSHGSESPAEARTPRRGVQSQPTTPHRMNQNRTPQAHTPTRIPPASSAYRSFPRVHTKPPDFQALAREQNSSHRAGSKRSSSDNFIAYNPEKEPIKAYLRIRPRPPGADLETEQPYLQVVDDLEVSMTPPENSNAYRTRNRAPERYKFTKIFTESVTQQDFFNKTTLPLIQDVLRGENALIFAYGVTNSGKTYTVMGTKEDTGLLPRTLDVIFNSVKGYVNDSKLKPAMHSLVQAYEDPAEENRQILRKVGHHDSPHPGNSNPDLWYGFQPPAKRDRTIISIDEKFEYGIWVSYAEIYTEKIYDLLVPPDRHSKRKQLSLKYEFRSGHKYISGLKEVKVQNIEEAYALLYEGQRNRAVYSTLMNHTSSRSHSIFTIRIVRVPIDDEDYVIEDPSYATVSKMSIVDLAGSERHRNTFNTGQRLKEAGNINKSLMVLGQCMETLRLNQMKAEMGKRQAIVPFRHSKLTELFKSSFEGDGKAVMVVNVNPFDTGFDENSHVMKFAAVAKDVATWKRIHPKLDLHGVSGSVKRLRTSSDEKRRAPARPSEDTELFAFEDLNLSNISEDDDDDDGEADDPFVDNLIFQLEDLRDKWIEAESRCATLESTIRQEVAKEMETELRRMEDIYVSALKRENEMNHEHLVAYSNSQQETDEDHQAENPLLVNLQIRQENLTQEIERLRMRMQEHEATKQSLLQKISQLESEKRQEQESVRRLAEQLREQTNANNERNEDTAHNRPDPENTRSSVFRKDPSFMDLDNEDSAAENLQREDKKDEKFKQMLELRKQLRRSVFKGKEYSPDADSIMSQVENFDGVTFELVKETNMGKLMKLIAQKKFENDPHKIQERAIKLFKHFARLSIPVLAPPALNRSTTNPRDSIRTVVVSVDAGREEDLISEMRVALDTLQHENAKLKTKIKAMQEGHRRLKEAFEKTRDLGSDITFASAGVSVAVNNNGDNVDHGPMPAEEPPAAESELSVSNRRASTASSVAYGSVMDTSMLSVENASSDEELSGDGASPFLRYDSKPKRKRKLRARQGAPST